MLVILTVSSVFSQTIETEDSHRAITEMEDSSDKVDQLLSLSKSLMYQEPDLSLGYLHEAEELSKVIGYSEPLGDILKTQGNVHYAKGDYLSAINCYISSLGEFRNNGDTLNMGNVYNNLGILYEEQDDVEASIKYYNQGLDIFQDLSDFKGQAIVYLNLGVLEQKRDNYDQSIDYYEKADVIVEEIHEERLGALLKGNIGYAYMSKGRLDLAEEYFGHSHESFEQLGDTKGLANSFANLGELNINQGNFSDAVDYLDEGADLATEHGYKSDLLETYRLQTIAHEKMGDYEVALGYHQKYKTLSDSIFSAEKDQALIALELQRDHRKELDLMEKEQEVQAQKLKAATFKNYLLIATTAFALIITLVASYYFMNKQKVSSQLRLQNEEISKQKREIDLHRKMLAEANKRLKDKNQRLNQLNKDKDYLLHVVAHDLKSPLNQMTGLSQIIMLEEDRLSESQKDYLSKIETVSSRLSNMVDKILDIDAIERKSNNINLEETDIRELLQETISDFEKVASTKNISIRSNINGEPNIVKIDKEHTLQIFENLLSNAIKFSPPNKEVYVSLERNGSSVIAEVKDQGPGLTDEDLQKVFKKFQKLSAQPTADEASNGLGLSIVKKYVEAMKGKVWVESEYGKGASFKVSFQKA